MNRGAVLLVLLFVSAGVTSCGGADEPAAAIDAGVLRIPAGDVVGGDLASIRDFAFVDSTLFVLDFRQRAVVVLRRFADSWRAVRTFGRSGGGPGEFDDPVALDFDSARGLVAVLQRGGRIELFDTAGVYQRTETTRLPCLSARVQLAHYGEQRLVAQSCRGAEVNGLAADTMYVVLASVAADREPRLITRQATATVNGKWGSIIPASAPLAIGRDSVLFAGGFDNCLLRSPAREPLRFAIGCHPAMARYAMPPMPPMPMGGARWPRHIPLFDSALFVGTHPVLARPFSEDSMILESVRAPGHHVAVASLDAFVACKPAGCLWFHADASRLKLVTESELLRLLP